MINYFFYTDSFKGADTALIKSCIEDLNKAVLERSRHEAFYEDYSFYTADMLLKSRSIRNCFRNIRI